MTGVVVWLTGLPASGKTTLARRLRDRVIERRGGVCVLDGDEVRRVLSPSPGYDERGRADFYRTLADLAALLAGQGQWVLVSATSHLRSFRDYARKVAPDFLEVYVSATAEECERREFKGLYARARAGELSGLPGFDLEYEAPVDPDVEASGGEDSRALDEIARLLHERDR